MPSFESPGANPGTKEDFESSSMGNAESVDSVSKYEFDIYGPKVGRVLATKENGETTELVIRALRDPGYPGAIRFSLYLPGENSPEGHIILRTDQTSENLPSLDPENPELIYGNENPPRFEPKVFIENMVNGYNVERIDQTKEHHPSNFRGIGTALHRAAIEWSLLQGCEGRVQLEVQGDSFGFHENFGFLVQDLKNKDGSMKRAGETIHEQFSQDRRTAEQEYADGEINPRGRELSQREYVQKFGDKKRYISFREEKIYMYLPKEIIQKEVAKMDQGDQELLANAATIEQLLEKHEALKDIERVKIRMRKQEKSQIASREEIQVFGLRDIITICQNSRQNELAKVYAKELVSFLEQMPSSTYIREDQRVSYLEEARAVMT